ncbi:DMT family transporter [Sulfurimonas sp. HSL-3221]|uniref:DMT family transporter n=1 Tax=Sulfurimonadaceae TaxID=2771471 RepID=UPI001E49B62C|nr:DMT family transporter [Sulfurimonas sp. HSL-3221]UFS63591.1 DMT family transporter [Sulfurimonas sp. HSL-3221]
MYAMTLYLTAFAAGIALAVQGGFNAQLGVMLKNPFLATLIAYTVSTLFALLYLMGNPAQLSLPKGGGSVPLYLWVAGGFFSVIGIALYYYIIPKIGISKMFTFGLSGQMVFVMIAGAFGWFGLPMEAITYKKLAGLAIMLSGVALITYEG